MNTENSANKFGLTLGKERHGFSAAHMTVFPDGSKEPLHGHNYQVQLTIDLSSVQFESFLDFGIIKNIVEKLCFAWNDKLLLAAQNKFFKIVRHDAQELEFLLSGKRYVVPSDEVALLPTENVAVENLAVLFADRFADEIRAAKQKSVLGFQVTISESPGQGGTCIKRV